MIPPDFSITTFAPIRNPYPACNFAIANVIPADPVHCRPLPLCSPDAALSSSNANLPGRLPNKPHLVVPYAHRPFLIRLGMGDERSGPLPHKEDVEHKAELSAMVKAYLKVYYANRRSARSEEEIAADKAIAKIKNAANYARKRELEAEAIRTKRYYCPDCDRVEASSSKLNIHKTRKSHLDKVAGKVTPEERAAAEAQFAAHAGRRRAQEAKNIAEKLYLCPECQKA